MLGSLIVLYCVIGFVSWILSIRWMKSRGWVDGEDLINSFLLFGVMWSMGIPLALWSNYNIGSAILDWINK